MRLDEGEVGLGSFKGSKLGALFYQLLVNYIVRHITDSWKYNYGKFVLC